jgi:choline dehydrogenase-like flavoprotein
MVRLAGPLLSVARAQIPEAAEEHLVGAADLANRLLDAFDPLPRAGVAVAVRAAAVTGLTHPLLAGLLRFAYYEQVEVCRSIGYDPDPFVRDAVAGRETRWADDIAGHRRLLLAPTPGRPPAPGRPLGDISSARDIGTATLECDVVVVGSGAGGSVAAAELAESGLDVIVLEEGGHHPTASFTTSASEMLMRLYRGSGLTATVGRAPVGYVEGRCVGGSTVINGAMTFRASERVLSGWVRDSGVAELSAESLAPSYERIEELLSVGPQDPGTAGRDQEILLRGARSLGWRTVENQRAQVHCCGCNVCVWGCPSGAKQSALVAMLPRAVRFGARILADCRVTSIEFHGERATGVRARVADGESTRTLEVRADAVVVAAGAIETPALLIRSGVRTPSNQVGHHLYLHPGAGVAAVFDEEVNGWEGAHQVRQVREFEDDGVVLAAVNLPPSLVARSLPLAGAELAAEMASYAAMVTAGVLAEDRHAGRVRVLRGRPVPSYRVTQDDADRVTTAIAHLAELLLTAGALRVHLPVKHASPLRSVEQARALPESRVGPTDLELSTVHLMGTARMGADQRTAVCAGDGSVFGRRGLYVADASLFPGPVGINPSLTVMALALQVARGVAGRDGG